MRDNQICFFFLKNSDEITSSEITGGVSVFPRSRSTNRGIRIYGTTMPPNILYKLESTGYDLSYFNFKSFLYEEMDCFLPLIVCIELELSVIATN